MIRYLYADQLPRYPRLGASMFRDRAAQFRDRLGWAVTVDEAGFERDAYDGMNPLYVLWERADGSHGGSMRFLPTVGPTMVNDHFRHLSGGGRIESPVIWECTRFCLAEGAGAQVSAALMQAGGEIMRHFGIRHFVGVFDARMVRVYRLIGASPEILGSDGIGRDRVSVGLWAFSGPARRRLSRTSGVSDAVSAHWFRRAFGTTTPPRALSA